MDSEISHPGSAGSISDWEPLADGVWRLVAEPDHVTIGLVAGTQSALLIDCGSTPEQGRRLLASARERAGVPVRHVVITHPDRDHWFGLAGVLEDGDIDAWAHESVPELLADPDAELLADLERLGLERSDLRAPENVFSMVRPLDLGELQVELIHLGAGHTASDVLVNVPARDVLLTGDLIENPAPFFSARSDPRGWPDVLNMVIGMVRTEAIVVPGHGDPVDKTFLTDQLVALAKLPAECERLARSGVRLEQAEQQGEWPLPWPNIAAGVERAFSELADQGVRRRLPMADGH